MKMEKDPTHEDIESILNENGYSILFYDGEE